MNKVTIILPIYRGKEITLKTIESIRKNTFYPYEMFVIADDFNEDYSYLSKLDKVNHISKIILRQEREGVISAINDGILLTNNDIVLIQNDAEFPDLGENCWLTRLVNKVTDKVGMVGCQNSVRERAEHGYIGGWCCFIPRKIINRVGLLDEIYGFAMMDDIDYARRVQVRGLTLETEASFEVKHLDSQTLKGDGNKQEEWKKRNWDIYCEKWKDYKVDMTEEQLKRYDFWR